MYSQPDFEIKPWGKVSNEFLLRDISTFKEAAEFVRYLPYGRNVNKEDLTSIFTDNCGTCSTKHGLLKTLANENKFNEIELVLGLFKMNGINTPKVRETLRKNQLEYIPEAHNYLRYNHQLLDFTTSNSKPSDFLEDLIAEQIIQPNQITDFKVSYHKTYIKKWLNENKEIDYTIEEVWVIREKCIKDLEE